MELHGVNQAYLSKLWRVSPTYVSDLMRGRRSISAAIALKLEATFGLPTALEWMTLQAKEDLIVFRPALTDELVRISIEAGNYTPG